MKQGWKIKKLGDICYPKKEIKRASTYCSSSDRITYIDISSIDAASNRIVAPNEMLFKDAPSRAQQMVMKHDVLVSLVRPNLKNIAMVHTAIDYLVASSGFCVLRTKENPYYIKYLVTGEKFTKYLMSRTSGANYPAVREDDIRSFQICVPPIAEQEKIVAELDCISGIIEKKKQQLKELDNLAQSIFYEMFGDPVENDKGWERLLFEKCIEKVRYTAKIATCNYATTGTFPIISQEEDYISGYWNNAEDVFMISKPVVIFGDHTRVLKYVDFDFVLGADGVKILQPIDTINAKFFLYYLIASKIPSLGYSRHYKLLKELKVLLPPLALQQDFASKIESIEKQKELLAQSIKETETLFNSRMDYYFN